MTDEGDATILIVDDQNRLADLHATNLRDEYEVRVAYRGEEALELLDGVDVMLLDRRMPGMSGDEVLRAVSERAPHVRVAITTAVDPDFDIIDMPFDEYLVKPIVAEDLHETIERLLRLAEYDEKHRELGSKRFRVQALAAEKSDEELEDHDEYQQLRADATALEGELDELSEELQLSNEEIKERIRR